METPLIRKKLREQPGVDPDEDEALSANEESEVANAIGAKAVLFCPGLKVAVPT